MGCKSCSKKYIINTCRVCELTNNDKSKKRTKFCNLCNAYICHDCNLNIFKRGEAFIKNLFNGNTP